MHILTYSTPDRISALQHRLVIKGNNVIARIRRLIAETEARKQGLLLPFLLFVPFFLSKEFKVRKKKQNISSFLSLFPASSPPILFFYQQSWKPKVTILASPPLCRIDLLVKQNFNPILENNTNINALSSSRPFTTSENGALAIHEKKK